MSPRISGSARLGTVLFDLDGVLMDHTRAAQEAIRSWLGERLTPEVEAAWFSAQDRRLAEWRAGTLSWGEQRRARLRDVLPLVGEPVGTDDELDRLFASGYGAAYRRSWHGFADAGPAIAALHDAGLATAVLTNGAEDQQVRKLRSIGLADVIGPVFTAEALGLRKPDPRAFLEVCGRLGVEPSTVLYVGDEHEVDVLGARSAGLHAVLLDRFDEAPPEESEVVRTLTELVALLTP